MPNPEVIRPLRCNFYEWKEFEYFPLTYNEAFPKFRKPRVRDNKNPLYAGCMYYCPYIPNFESLELISTQLFFCHNFKTMYEYWSRDLGVGKFMPLAGINRFLKWWKPAEKKTSYCH